MAFSITSVVLLAVIVALLMVVRREARRGKESQSVTLESLRKESPDYPLARIYIARPAHFHRRMKLLAFEARAVLQVTPERARVMGLLDGKPLDWTYPRSDLDLEWIGNPGIASANLHWISLGSGDRQLMLSADTGFVAVQSREATADLCALLDPRYKLPDLAKAEFAIEKNPASLGSVVLFFALLAYAVLDGVFINPYQVIYVRAFAVVLLVLLPALALLVPIPAYLALTKKHVPSRESLVLSLLVSAGFVCAGAPAIKRVDQLLSADGPRVYEYRLVKDARFVPVEPGPPDLSFPRARDFWAQFEKDSTHRFTLLKGPLGIWQLDDTELVERARRFYRAGANSEGK